MSAPLRLELRLLGGFEARLGRDPVTGFESRKARALLAFLALHRDRAVDRDVLANLLWGERGDESARRNLRQALYSIRTALASAPGVTGDIVVGNNREIGLGPQLETWVDVLEFRSAFETGATAGAPDPQQLSRAAQLYKGDFLAGFYLRDCPEFETWQFTLQEELRDEALETFRTLVEVYLARGEHRYGVRYAKRLLSIDPLSEEGHRQLMRLHVQAGRRSRALAQYEHLLNLLRDELGVAPMEETTELYRSILLEGYQTDDSADDDDATPPLIPLVGRTDAIATLKKEWEAVVGGAGRLTWISGEAGAGKSRLAKSVVDGETSKRHAVVIRGHCHAAAAPVAYGPFAELLASALYEVVPDEDISAGTLDSEALSELRRLAAATGHLPAAESDLARGPRTSPTRIAASLLELVDLLCHPRGQPSRPLIMLLEDLQWSDSASRIVLELLAGEVEQRPMWILVTGRDAELADGIPSLAKAKRVPLGRLSEANVEEIASSIVDLESVPPLVYYLWRLSEGLPLKLAELVNLLWDEQLLRPGRPGQWELAGSLDRGFDEAPSLSEPVRRRARALPTSARRLLSVAAVYGHDFDVEVLQVAADEHLKVVETCVELALERWLIRQFPRSWSPAGLEKDIVLWARGARRGYFEFSHDQVRQGLLDLVNPIRHAVMHRDLAHALEKHYGARAPLFAEELAYHWLGAQEPERALPWLEAAAGRAADWGAADLKDDYLDKALEVVTRLERGSKVAIAGLEETRERLLALQHAAG